MDTSITFAGVAAFLVIEILKALSVNIESKYFPVLSVIIAAIVSAVYNGLTAGFNAAFILNDFLEGIVAGLTASGGYDFIKTIGKKD